MQEKSYKYLKKSICFYIIVTGVIAVTIIKVLFLKSQNKSILHGYIGDFLENFKTYADFLPFEYKFWVFLFLLMCIVLIFFVITIFFTIINELNLQIINFRYKYGGRGTIHLIFYQFSFISIILLFIALLSSIFDLTNGCNYWDFLFNHKYITVENVSKLYLHNFFIFMTLICLSKVNKKLKFDYKSVCITVIVYVSIIFLMVIVISKLYQNISSEDLSLQIIYTIMIVELLFVIIYIELSAIRIYFSYKTNRIDKKSYDILSIYITCKKANDIQDFYKHSNFYIPKNQEFDINKDYIMLIVSDKNKITSKYVKSISLGNIHEKNNNDVLLLDASSKKYYDSFILEITNLDNKLVYDYTTIISDKQVFGIDEVYVYYKFFNKIRKFFNKIREFFKKLCRWVKNLGKTKTNEDTNENTNEDIYKIKLATLKHLVVFENDEMGHSGVDINYLKANYGAGKSTITNIYKNSGQKIFRFSLLSSNFKSSFFEKLYFSLKYENKNYLTRSTIIFFGAIFLAFLFSLLNNIIDIFALEYVYSKYLNILNISIIILGIFFALYIKDYVFSLNISNNYIKEDTYVKKILKYIEQNNILLVIEDHDRIFDSESVKLINTSFTMLYETKRNASKESSIVVTGMDLDKYTELVEKNNDHYYIANDFYGKIFSIINKNSINSKEKIIFWEYVASIVCEYNGKITSKTSEKLITSKKNNMRELKNTTYQILEVIRENEYRVNLDNDKACCVITEYETINNMNMSRMLFPENCVKIE